MNNYTKHQVTQPAGPTEQPAIKNEADQLSPRNASSLQPHGHGPSLPQRLYRESFVRALQFARQSGVYEARDADVQMLETNALAWVETLPGDLFDPQRHAHDRLQQERFEQKQRDRDNYVRAVRFASADFFGARKQLAALPLTDGPPRSPVLFHGLTAVVMALSVVLTFSDNFFTALDEPLHRLLGASIVALIYGCYVLACNFGGDAAQPHSRWAFIGILLQSAAFFVMRVAFAATPGEWYWALAFWLFESGIAITIERKGVAHRQARLNYQTRLHQRQHVQDECAAAQRRYEYYTQLLTQTEQALQEHRRLVSERAQCHAQREALKALATKAVREGYQCGVEQNFRYVFGAGVPLHLQKEAA